MVKNPPSNAENAGRTGSIPGLGRSPAVGNGNPLLYSCLDNPMDIHRRLEGYVPQGSQRVEHH